MECQIDKMIITFKRSVRAKVMAALCTKVKAMTQAVNNPMLSTQTHRLTKYHSYVPATMPKCWGKKAKATTKVTPSH